MAWQRVKIKIPEDYRPSEREAIGDDVVDWIVNRTKKGKGVRAKGRGFEIYDFDGYSDSYINSLKFRQAGKSPSKVNLTLSGDMLTAVELLSQSKGELIVGIQRSDKENNDKATGLATGNYGGNKGPVRSFIGLTSSEKKTILSNYPLKDKERREEAVAESEEARKRTR